MPTNLLERVRMMPICRGQKGGFADLNRPGNFDTLALNFLTKKFLAGKLHHHLQ